MKKYQYVVIASALKKGVKYKVTAPGYAGNKRRSSLLGWEGFSGKQFFTREEALTIAARMTGLYYPEYQFKVYKVKRIA